ncbi:MAG TPA: hypothetical protein VEV19_01210 [Ktedonobacteraceae bacterium]|nr:hypothetical protein [Ktedonobacteraceae bacterium]
MAESIVQPDTNDFNEHENLTGETDQVQATSNGIQEDDVPVASHTSTIIWTPRFIVLFALTLAIGLTADSLFTMAWSLHYVTAAWVSLGYIVLITGCLLGTVCVARSPWSRLGGIFGTAWAIFTSVDLVLTLYTLAPTSPVPAYLNAAISSALLGTYLCLSLEQTSLTRWDGWFFSMALLVSLTILCLTYFLAPAASRSLAPVASNIAATLLALSILVWWLRPSCWKTQPGPTLLFGLMPAIFLLLNVTTLGKGQPNFFLSQIAYLFLLLGTMRIFQGELRRKKVLPSLS